MALKELNIIYVAAYLLQVFPFELIENSQDDLSLSTIKHHLCVAYTRHLKKIYNLGVISQSNVRKL